MAQTLINNYNIDGLECYYSLFTQQQTNDLVELCKKINYIDQVELIFMETINLIYNLEMVLEI